MGSRSAGHCGAQAVILRHGSDTGRTDLCGGFPGCRLYSLRACWLECCCGVAYLSVQRGCRCVDHTQSLFSCMSMGVLAVLSILSCIMRQLRQALSSMQVAFGDALKFAFCSGCKCIGSSRGVAARQISCTLSSPPPCLSFSHGRWFRFAASDQPRASRDITICLLAVP